MHAHTHTHTHTHTKTVTPFHWQPWGGVSPTLFQLVCDRRTNQCLLHREHHQNSAYEEYGNSTCKILLRKSAHTCTLALYAILRMHDRSSDWMEVTNVVVVVVVEK